MAVLTTVTLEVTCDNPACPGNDLDPTTTDGWLMATAPSYSGEPQPQMIFCSPSCYSIHSNTLLAADEE